MPILAVTKHYRTTIPREVRKILELKENDEIEWMLENGKIVVRKVEKSNSGRYRTHELCFTIPL